MSDRQTIEIPAELPDHLHRRLTLLLMVRQIDAAERSAAAQERIAASLEKPTASEYPLERIAESAESAASGWNLIVETAIKAIAEPDFIESIKAAAASAIKAADAADAADPAPDSKPPPRRGRPPKAKPTDTPPTPGQVAPDDTAPTTASA